MRPKTISATSLQAAKDCLALFQAKHLDYVPESGKKEPAKRGSTVHYALQHFVRLVFLEKKAKWDDLVLLKSLYDEGYAEVWGTWDRATDWYTSGWEMVLEWHRRTDLTDVEVLSVEKKRRTPVPSARYDRRLPATKQQRGAAIIPMTYIWDRCDRFIHPATGNRVIRIVDYKALALSTPIPTPTGFTTMGEIQVGDELYGGDGGQVCRVIGKSEVKHERSCYRITFDDGTSVVCDEDHRWDVRLLKTGRDVTFDVRQMLEHGVKGRLGRQCDIAVMHTPIVGDKSDLLVDPYVLGAWIGDGSSGSAEITKPHEPLFDEISRRGYRPGQIIGPAGRRTIHGLRAQLVELGLLGNKHIPNEYLRAGYEQRLDLLRGIMDTDGHWNFARKRAVLNTTDSRYAFQVYELVCSLGWTARIFPVTASGFGEQWPAWQLWFTPTGEDVFLTRHPHDHGNGEYVAPDSVRPFRRVIKSIEPVDSEPVQCIMVDSPDHCFRIGSGFVKTHNTQNRPLSADAIRGSTQAKIYAIAAMIYFKDEKPDQIQIQMDYLQHDPVTVTFTVEDCVKMWVDLRRELQRILDVRDNQKLPRTLGTHCKYCPIAYTCPEHKKNVEHGGIHSLGVEEQAALRVELQQRQEAASALIKNLDQELLAAAENDDVTEFQAGEHLVRLKLSSRRAFSSQKDVMLILGVETYAEYAPMTMGKYDALMKGDEITPEQKRRLQAIVEKHWSENLSVEVVLDDEGGSQ